MNHLLLYKGFNVVWNKQDGCSLFHFATIPKKFDHNKDNVPCLCRRKVFVLVVHSPEFEREVKAKKNCCAKCLEIADNGNGRKGKK